MNLCNGQSSICIKNVVQGNLRGLTERLNRTLFNLFSMYVSSDNQDWDVALPFITFAYNSSSHEPAGYSPFYILVGRDPLYPWITLSRLQQLLLVSMSATPSASLISLARSLAHASLHSKHARSLSMFDATPMSSSSQVHWFYCGHPSLM